MITGTCHCGKNEFKLKGDAEFQFICYCNNCKHINSGGHLCGIMLDKTQLTVALETSTYIYPGGSGHKIELHFCGKCATHLYSWPLAYPGKVVVRANTLSDAQFKPQQLLFKESAFLWDK